HLVVDDRTAERPAVLIEVAHRVRGRREEVTRIPLLILTAVETRSAEVVRTRAADHVDLPAGHAAILRRQDAFDDLDFRDRVEAHDRYLILAAILSQRSAFRIRVRLGAIDGDACADRPDAVHLHAA